MTPKPNIDLLTPKSSNPWLALAEMNKQSSFSSPFPRGTFAAASESPSITSLLKRSVNMNSSIANTAAALMSSPSTMRAFSDMRKLDMTTNNLQEKIKAAAKTAAASVSGKVWFINDRIFLLPKV
jgi:hypothetical protein